MARVALTFDNGPDPVGTPRVLDVLRRRQVPATFFAVGNMLDAPGGLDLARRVVDEGHRLGNHTYSHGVPLGDDGRPDAVALELERTEWLLDQVAPDRERLFRPHGGGGVIGPHLLSRAALDWLRDHGHTCVLWTSVPGDFRDPDGWVEPAMADAARVPHSVTVLHDAFPEAMRHLDELLGRLLDAGHELTDAFPASCLPLVRGVAAQGLDAIVRPVLEREVTP